MSQAIEKDKIFTYGDIENYPENEKWELIDGIPYLQAQPSPLHQICAAQITSQFVVFLKGKPCKILPETAVFMDLKPTEKNKFSKKYVVPDILIICDENKIQNDGIYGVPDLIIEILSPSTAGVDGVKKFNQYFTAGVKEYWIVDPANSLITVFTLKDGEYKSRIYDRENNLPVGIFNGELEIITADVFPVWKALE